MNRPVDEFDFDSLGITDDLMFGTVFQDRELCRRLVETLLGIQVESVEFVEPQRKLSAGPLARAGVVDILVREPSGKVFDVEMQNEVGANIAKRARYYLSLVNTKMLSPGQDFDKLSGSVVIFICAHDPFNRGWKRYNFRRTCAQDGVELNDGTEIVFINAEGTRGDVGPELDAFIRYIQDDTMVESDYVRTVDDAVREVRDDPVWRGLRMLWSEKYRDDFAEARREGLQEGREEGRASVSRLAAQLEAVGRSDELLPALRNPERLTELLREFGIQA